MRFELLGMLSLILGVAVIFAPVRLAFFGMVFSTLFGAAAALSLGSLGGASVLVPSLFLVFYCLRLLMAFGEGPVLAAVLRTQAGFWLLLLTVYAVLSAYFLPRLMEGVTETMIVLRSSFGRSIIDLVPLSASTNNITQAVYALGGLFCFAFTCAFMRRLGRPADLVNAMLLVAGFNLAFALADLVTFHTGTAHLLEVFHTANYALLTGSEKGGFKRISGTFSEASAFAGYTVVLFAFVASLWLDRVRTLITAPLAVLLLLALLFSTSTTALLSLAAVLAFLFLRLVRGSLGRQPSARPAFLAGVLLLVPVAVMLLIATAPAFLQDMNAFFDEMLFSKLGSQSGRERSLWNAVAFQVFLDTWGIGAGLGSARASSYALVLLSNLGVAGMLLFLAFIGTVLLAQEGGDRSAGLVLRAAKAGLVASLCEAFVSGTVYDLGLMFYVLAGAATALARAPVTVSTPAGSAALLLEGRR